MNPGWPLQAGSRAGAAALLAAALLCGGCATMTPPDRPADAVPSASDPWEAFNRKVFAFNEGLDEAVLKPVAQVWQRVMPQPVRAGITRVFANVADIWSSVNLLLQGKVQGALETGMRVGVNTVFGVFGIFDVAETVGLERIGPEDLGQTLGHWGVPPGPFLMLPILGPSTLRDGIATPADLQYGSPNLFISGTNEQLATTGLNVVNTRARLLGATKVLDDIALDKYVLLRDGYLARRRNQVYDGNPPDNDAAEAGTAPSAPEAPASAAPSAPPAASAVPAIGPALAGPASGEPAK